MNYYALFFGVSLALTTQAQIQPSPSGQPDTSFTVLCSYQKELKYHPEIRLADASVPAGVKKVSSKTYRKLDKGRELKLDLFYKDQKNTRPAVLMVHGGGWRSGDRTHNYTLAQQLAARGYVAIPVEYRLSTEALYPAAVQDLKAAVSWVRTHAKDYQINPQQIAILGFSAGGQLAALIGTTNGNPKFEGPNQAQNSTVQGIIDIDGTLAFIHPESGEGDDSRSISAATYWFGYSKKEKPERWDEAGALNHAGPQTPPVLFLNSSVARMHAGREDFIQILNKHGIYSEVHTFENAPHTFLFFEPWFTPTLQYIDRFLQHIFPIQ